MARKQLDVRTLMHVARHKERAEAAERRAEEAEKVWGDVLFVASALGDYGGLSFRRPMNGHGWRISLKARGLPGDGNSFEDGTISGAFAAVARHIRSIGPSPTVAASEPSERPAEVTHEQAREECGRAGWRPRNILLRYISQSEARDRRIAELEAELGYEPKACVDPKCQVGGEHHHLRSPHVTHAELDTSVRAIIAEVAERANSRLSFDEPALLELAEAAKEAKGG